MKHWRRRKVTLKYRNIVRHTQSRLRRRNIWVHNILVREVVRVAFNVVTERIKKDRERFFDNWTEQSYVSMERRERTDEILKRRYDRKWYRMPRVKVVYKYRTRKTPRKRKPKKWDIQAVSYLTGTEYLALIELRDEMVRTGDIDSVAGLNKAIKYLREIENC